MLMKPSNPVTNLLLGDNIDQKMTEIFKVSQATKRRGQYLVKDRFQARKKTYFRKNRYGMTEKFVVQDKVPHVNYKFGFKNSHGFNNNFHRKQPYQTNASGRFKSGNYR